MPEDVRYGIAALADLGGVSRRTVRYYVQEGLLPPPYGVGRGDHYGPLHLEQLRQVTALQHAGRSLHEIRALLAGPPGGQVARPAAGAPPRPGAVVEPVAPPPSGETWRRLVLVPGVELHVRATIPLPARARLQELAAWCRTHLSPDPDLEDSDA